ncbi:hypothetical protein X777_01855, partial [Ooceraea biroi]
NDSEDNDSEANDSVDIQSNASLQSERQDNNSDNSEDENENIFIDENEKEQRIIQLIREWALEAGHLSMKKLDNLFGKLNTIFPHIPKSYKTLLSTPANLKIDKFNDGSAMWYKGIKKNLDTMQMEQYLHIYGKVIIDINIDGLPLFKFSKTKFLPILGYLTMTKNAPFIIVIYFGKIDPKDLNTFLGEYVNEVENLLNNGYIFNNKKYPFQIRHYICDAPARSFIKCCIGHCGYASCEKCTVIDEWIDDRVTYTDLDEIPRTDYSFLQ